MSANHLNNGFAELKENLTMTGMFLVLLIFSAVDTDLIAFVVVFVFLFVLVLLKPTITILNGNADHFDMSSFVFVPIIGLLRIYWKPYQRMAQKLMNEDAFKECEKALELMKNSIEAGWPQFCENFPKIEVSDETRKRRYELVKLALQYCVANGIREAKNELRIRGDILAYKELLKNVVNIANPLYSELKQKILNFEKKCDNMEITQDAYDKELEKRVSVFVKLQKKLNDTNGSSTSVFGDLREIMEEKFSY